MEKYLLAFVILVFVTGFSSISEVQGQELIPNLDLEAVDLRRGNVVGDSVEIIFEIGVTILDSQVVTVDTTTGVPDTIYTFPFDSTIFVPEVIMVDQEEAVRCSIKAIGPKGPVNVCRLIIEDMVVECTEKPGKTCPELKIIKCGKDTLQIPSVGCKWNRADPNNPDKLVCACSWNLPKQKPKIPKPSDGAKIELKIDPNDIMPEYDETNNTMSCTYPATAVELSSFTATGYDSYVKVEWTTETEIDNAGFNLHRGLSKDSPNAQLNPELIPAKGDELQGATYSFTDYDVTNGVIYYYWLEDVDLHGNSTMHGPVSATPTSVEEREEAPIPTVFSLAQNYPNPFNPTTEIKYGLPVESDVSLTIYNLGGQRVATLVDGKQKAGYKTARWDAGSFSSGIYFYRLQTGDFVQTRKMVLLK